MKDVPTWGKKILPLVLPFMVEAENFSDHHRTCFIKRNLHLLIYRLHVSYDQIMGFSQKVS